MQRSALLLTFALMLLGAAPLARAAEPKRPNVILIITDDQGYGDIGAHGNEMIQTPHMDKLHGESVRLTDYHVDPTCSPTRSALMTGRYSTRTGVWHTINGRSMMAGDELTLAEVFRANGYRTAMFGKWHLGDNAPLRPMDQGFEHVVWHKGGGVGQGPDYWDNDYFDDTYWVGETPKKFEGYCTDVWFDEAINYVEQHRAEPFFVYLSTNAPHGPYFVADKYADPYKKKGVGSPMAEFYGMITNIDDNLGKLRAKLDALGIADDTLLIYTTDNGTAAGARGNKEWPGFNAGMKGNKGSQYDGGHRVPMFWHWPGGKLTGGRDVDPMTAHIDVLPTMIALLDLKKPAGGKDVDGMSIAPLLRGAKPQWPDRTLFVHRQRQAPPPKWNASVAMRDPWRLVDGKELYDIDADPGQKNDVAKDHPEIVKELRADYEKWWASLEPGFDGVVRIDLGGAENPTQLMSHDWLMPGAKFAAWHQNHVRSGAAINGPWAVNVVEAGAYEITLHRWPAHLDKAMGVTAAELTIAGETHTQDPKPDATAATFRVNLPAGPTMLESTLTPQKGGEHGAYFVTVKRVE